MKTKKKRKIIKKEEILNIPNILSLSRIVITFVIIFLALYNVKIWTLLIWFVIGALTDFLDGQIARRFNLKTEFGRKADMIADRFLWIGAAFAFGLYFYLDGLIKPIHVLEFLLIMSREIISAPAAIRALIQRKPIPQAIYIAKVTTFLQGFAIPAIVLSIFYPIAIWASLPLAIATFITGVISGSYYARVMSGTYIKRNIYN